MAGEWRKLPDPIPEDQIRETHSAELLVLGLGYAGTAAARAAAESGADVIGIEMMEREKYVSFGCDVGHINSEFLKSRGVPEVDPIDFYNDWMMRAGNRANPSLIMKFAQNSGKAFDWFTDMYGVEGLKDLHVGFWPEGAEKFRADKTHNYNGFHFWHGTAKFPDPRGWPGSPTLWDLVKANFEVIEQHGGRLFFGQEILQPVIEADGRISAVITRTRDGEYIKYIAEKSVILAMGDFAGNPEMYAELVSDITELHQPDKPSRKCFSRNGRGIQFGVWAGGKLEPKPLPAMGGNTPAPETIASYGILWLDRRGRRFTNEIMGGAEFAWYPAAVMPQGTYYNIFDEHLLEDLQWSFPSHMGFDENDGETRGYIEAQLEYAVKHPRGSDEPFHYAFKSQRPHMKPQTTYSGDTPEELVANAGIEGELADQIVASIRRYIEVCEKGRDDDFGKDSKLLRPFRGKLFLQKCEQEGVNAFSLVTVGGLLTDADQNVLDECFEPIPGLYATGNCCGRRFGPQYSSPIAGVSIGIAITLGRECGLSAAAAAKNN